MTPVNETKLAKILALLDGAATEGEAIAALNRATSLLEGTGLTLEQFARGVAIGIRKINIGTEVKTTYIGAFIDTHEKNVSAYDMVGIPQACKNAVAAMVQEKLEFFARGYKALI